VAAIATGILMMFRIDTPIFAQNQYLLNDGSWGFVYVLHGVGGVSLIGLVIAHVYFAIRPDKRWLTRSMFKGWITRDEYLAHHDPERWAVASKQEIPDRDEAVLLPR
ncbi:MAG: cytochrome b/b6 domain-containing protein, partial [Longimicrobiales bacterium]